MNLQHALKIKGFTIEKELLWLAEKASHCTGNIAEIGSWQGRSTRAMADNTTATIYAVDTWAGSGKEHELELAGKDTDWLFNQFVANIGEEHLREPHHVRICRDENASLFYADYLGNGTYQKKFEMIFIDAAHDYESVKADILAWRPLLTTGGLLCGHDFDGGRPGVVQAVRELCGNQKMAGAGSIWFIPPSA